MNGLEHIKNDMQEWIDIDKKIQILNAQLKELKSQKQSLNEVIVESLEEQNLTDTSFRFDDVKLNYCTKKQTSPITINYLESKLKEIISDDDQANIILKYIIENRKQTIKRELKSSFFE